MGAYYTKEDITEYIGKNCILPFLMDEVKTRHATSLHFKPTGFVWQTLKDSEQKYIYDAVKKGYGKPLPEEIERGIDVETQHATSLLERRKEWNKPTTEEFALPTEIWRETVERLQRCEVITHKIKNGEITQINDFITYNLDIRTFVFDLLATTDDHLFIKHFYQALQKISILDPTCGSGAFLFAALNILEPLYEVCIDRMEEFHKQTPTLFKEELEEIQSKYRSNIQYFIYKSIILRNLYGVDIMKEATEIAKLRLFLKMVAVVDVDKRADNLGLDPLPDIDFNIRCGNTLIGFASLNDAVRAINAKDKTGQMGLVFDDELDIVNSIKNKADDLARVFKSFKHAQLDDDLADFKSAKDKLQTYQSALNEILNEYLAFTYSIDAEKQKEKYQQWLTSHQPFHWFAEFYEIIHDKGGFDVIIGNPPYVNVKEINYSIDEKHYKCYECKDLFALTVEKSFLLNKGNGRNGFIIPLSGLSTEIMQPLRATILGKTYNTWNSYYSASDQPSSLFNGVRHRLLITINQNSNKEEICKSNSFSTNFLKWLSNEREGLFNAKINYCALPNNIEKNSKISRKIETSILEKLSEKKTLNNFTQNSGKTLYYHNAPVYWGKIFDFIPYNSIGGEQMQSSHLKTIYFTNEEDVAIAICLLNSSLFYWFNWQYSNCRDLSTKDVFRIPISLTEIDNETVECLVKKKEALMKDLKLNSKIYVRVSKGVTTEFDSFYPAKSKSIIDEIDKVLAEHYGFTEEELDFIINYDIKYRMGSELNEEE
jgi:hypothetical protein